MPGKAAFLRKHGLGPAKEAPAPAQETPAVVPEPKSPRSVATPAELTWKQKRAQHITARYAGIQRTASATQVVEVTGGPIAPVDTEPHVGDVAFSAVNFAAKLSAKTWKQKRKEAFLNTHGERVSPKAVPTATVDAPPPLSLPPQPKPKSGEKSWTQKRRESYLKRYGRQPTEPPPPDVAISAVKFAIALKRRSSASERSTASNAGAAAAPVELS